MKIKVITRKVSGSTLPPLPSSRKKQRIPNKLVWTCVILLAVGLGAGRLMDNEDQREAVHGLSAERVVVRHVPEIPEITRTFHAPEPAAQASEEDTDTQTFEADIHEERTREVEKTPEPVQVPKVNPVDKDEPETTSPDPKEEERPVEPWQADRVYQPGDYVRYEDRVYVAERENQGIQPGAGLNGDEENPWKQVER
ncbi:MULTISPECIES: hypothetical protein [Thermoactinomyces]|uniref:hypothetical protein n=1 Tax=Thermoactinomyces TaxID=2023 RepID=UPI00050635E0|nr:MULTISPECIES: hypothetical protein [Thermoactinomyces]KFZ41441.1 hypothetical protein JS81_01215 [Thermoactinomyces sp. Gus2-1]KYQ86726.1 hypothetical protein AYX07_06155 [Thermoactinomyces sp. AS95]MBH8583069.1 hypothetical protein [Thermoactinomyces sp. CICC 10735]MBH8585858.1 hypothetical protein [Thermoactinomyces sp. CICC 10520]MBI0386643.1 hypothetical protein [Thermoactinomyces sp. CICC 24227]